MIHQIFRDLAMKLGPLVSVHFLFASFDRTPAAVSFDSTPFTANELKHAGMKTGIKAKGEPQQLRLPAGLCQESD